MENQQRKTNKSQMINQQEMQIEFVSPMAIAQKSQELQSIMKGLEIFGSVSNIVPITDYLDESGFGKQVTATLGLPAKLIKSDAEVAEARARKEQAQMQQMQMQQNTQESEMARNVAPLAKVINDGSKQ